MRTHFLCFFFCEFLLISYDQILQNFFSFQINDASLAYENFKPITKSNEIDRSKCLYLKSIVLNNFDYKKHANDEFEAAQKLCPAIDKWELDLN